MATGSVAAFFSEVAPRRRSSGRLLLRGGGLGGGLLLGNLGLGHNLLLFVGPL